MQQVANNEIVRVTKAIEAVTNYHYSKIAELTKLSGEMHGVLYTIRSAKVEKAKCKLCNTKRMIKYISPAGKEVEEVCSCSGFRNKYFPQRLIMSSCEYFKKDNDVLLYYVSDYGENINISLKELSGKMYHNTRYDGYIGKFFVNVEECNVACVFLNIDLS